MRLARRRVVVAVPLEDEADPTWGHVRMISLDDLRSWLIALDDAGAAKSTVARKIATNLTLLGVERFDLKYANGPMPHEQLAERATTLPKGTPIPPPGWSSSRPSWRG